VHYLFLIVFKKVSHKTYLVLNVKTQFTYMDIRLLTLAQRFLLVSLMRKPLVPGQEKVTTFLNTSLLTLSSPNMGIGPTKPV